MIFNCGIKNTPLTLLTESLNVDYVYFKKIFVLI